MKKIKVYKFRTSKVTKVCIEILGFNNHSVNRCECITHLDITIDDELTYQYHINVVPIPY